MDGILYATVSRNFSLSPGSLFDFTYNAKPFYDQPPLALWLQSFIFHIIGDSMYVERVFSFGCGLTSVFLIIQIWLKLNSKSDLSSYSWIPLFFFCSVPLVFWSYSNNMLENTLSVFALLSVYMQLLFLEKSQFFVLVFSGLSIFLAFLSKGLVGLFPLAFFFLYWLVFKTFSFSKMIVKSLLLIIFTGLFIILFFCFIPGSKEYFKTQFSAQVVSSLSGSVNLPLKPLLVPRRLVQELLPAIIFSLIFWVISFRRGLYSRSYHKAVFAPSLLFFLVGLSASLPIMASYKQRGYYLVPSLHFFILSISFFMGPIIKPIAEQFNSLGWFSRVTKIGVVIFALISISFSISSIGIVGRNQDKINDIFVLGSYIGKGKQITIAKNISEDWYLLGYFQRFFDISLIPIDGPVATQYFLTDNETQITPVGFTKDQLSLKGFSLFRRQ